MPSASPTAPSDAPEVTVCARETPAGYEIAVQDNGIGIEENRKGSIYGIFERLHTQEAYPGTGIGLSLVMKALTLHGGRLWYESEVGKGSTFYFTLDRELASTNIH